MKNQYFGDFNDYLKYSLLRSIAGRLPGGLLVCWMLTPDDGGSDGGLTRYLGQPEQFRPIDPPLFDALSAAVENGQRTVEVLQRSSLLPKASYHSIPLADSDQARASYFVTLWNSVTRHDAVFFDPDNGFAVASIPRGRRNSSKYLYWDEFEAAVERDLSTIVYQHFPRVAREQFLARMIERMRRIAPSFVISALYSARVGYLIAARPADAARFREATTAVQMAWGSRLRWMSP